LAPGAAEAPDRLDALRAPAGLAIGVIALEEIALSAGRNRPGSPPTNPQKIESVVD
jgi:hypothetical protein